MSLNDLISKLGVGKKEIVYMSITPSVGLEVILLDVQNKNIKNYACKPLYYNESLRELASIDDFKTAITDAFADLKLNTRCDVVLNIPMVLLGSRELPVLLADEAVNEALTSEAEQSYIFKRYEPVVSWVDSSDASTSGENRKFYYSAVQKNVIDDIKAALQELGMTLVDIQLSMMSAIRALIYSGFLEEQIKDGISWNLMLISSNGYSITSMVGKNVVDYYEEPLAIKSFEGEELYSAINASAQIALMSYPANYLVVVSETDLLSSELLASRLHFDGKISFYENNDFKKGDLIPVDYVVLEDIAHKISLEAIGNAVSKNVPLPLEFNFFGTSSVKKKDDDPDEPIFVKLGSYEFYISQNGARNMAMLFAVLVIIPFLLLFISVPMYKKSKQSMLDEINSKLEQANNQVKMLEAEQNKYATFDVNSEVKKVVANNRLKLMAYIALGEAVPKKLYLTYFVAKDDGKFDIKGKAESVQDVYTFYSNMKDSLINMPLRLHQLEMETKSVDDVVASGQNRKNSYKFEITNMSNPGKPETPPDNQGQNQEQGNGENAPNNAQNNAEASPNEQMLNKPLLNFGKDN